MMHYYERGWGHKFLWGLFWIILGVLILLANYGLLGFSFQFRRDWPIIPIAWGLLKLLDLILYRSRARIYYSGSGCGEEKKDYADILDALDRGELSPEDAVNELKKRQQK